MTARVPASVAEHAYVTKEIPFGEGAFFQAQCSCGWVHGIVHRVSRNAGDYAKRNAELVARGEFEQHFMVVMS